MPSIRPRPSRPSFYLDWSTLVYAFEGIKLDASIEHKELFRLVHDIARSANLCLSLAHLMELLRGENVRERIGRAAWLDSLDVVWLHDLDKVQDLELEGVLRRAVGLNDAPPGLPASASFLAQFPLTPGESPEVLKDGNVERFVRDAGNAQRVRDRLSSFSALGPYANRNFFLNRKRAENENSTSALREALKTQADQALFESALEVSKRLQINDPNYYIKKGDFWLAPDESFVRSVIRPFDEMRSDVPSFFVFHSVMRRAGDLVGRKEHVGSKFFKKDERKGDIFDWYHLIGAAYCDVFTCDKYTSDCLGDTRSQIGRTKEVVLRGDFVAFMAEIRGALTF